MANETGEKHSKAIDGRFGRVVAAVILVLGLGLFAYLNRASFIAAPPVEEEVAQPELAACLKRRMGAVENMRAENLLNDAQYEMFKSRAEAFCIYRFGDAESTPPTQ